MLRIAKSWSRKVKATHPETRSVDLPGVTANVVAHKETGEMGKT